MSPPPAVAPPEAVRLLKSHSLAVLVQRELERMILGGEIGVGAKLNEIELAARLGVSRGPVRESFRALEETGLVRIEKNRGVFVREISLAEADDIYEIRATFDQMAGRKLALVVTPFQLTNLRAILGQMEAAARDADVERYHGLNLRFHDALVEYANNPKLLQMYRRLVNELSLFRRLYEHAMASRSRMRALPNAKGASTTQAPPAPSTTRRPTSATARHDKAGAHASRRADDLPVAPPPSRRRTDDDANEAEDTQAATRETAAIKP